MRNYGQTFAPDQLGWIDFEARSDVDIGVGTYRYVASAAPMVLAVAVGEGPARALSFPLTWKDLPAEIRDHQARVSRGEAVWAAWNASFDRETWNQLCVDWPELDPHHIIDVMVQATAAGLPGKLDGAARYAHVPVKKRASGKDLIKLFCRPDSTATRTTHPDEWAEFLRYACDDVEAMRGVFRRTLQLPIEEWQEYWTSERINLNGIAFDQKLAERAEIMAALDKKNSARELQKLTNGAVDAVTKIKPMINWLKTVLRPADHTYLLRQAEEIDEETGEIVKHEKLSLDRRRIQMLSAMLDAKPDKTPGEITARRLLDIRQYGGSTTPAKFARMLESHVDGLLLGQYVFNGAPQTGRYSSRGIQLHNLMRDALSYEMDAIDALLNETTPETFAKLGDDTPISRKLSMLIRPTLIPESNDGVFVWGDWSQIEARVTPWLAGVESRLDIFRAVDADPAKPDLYTMTAAKLSDMPVEQVTPAMRQRGKVLELALGFCGGRGALQNMAAAYGLFFDDTTATRLVQQWREVNPWAIDFANRLWEGMRNAHEAPGHFIDVDKIGFIFLPGYLDGTLLMRLPSGRFLTYRGLRWETVNEYDDAGTIVDSKWSLTFARAYGRITLWRGFFVENCIAEGTSVLTESGWMAIEDITDERVWDGEAWVEHGGLIDKGVQDVIEIDGAWMTPDHEVLTAGGWKHAESVGSDRAQIRLPDGYSLCVEGTRSSVASALCLWQRARAFGQELYQRGLQILRMHASGYAVRSSSRKTKTAFANAQYVEASCLSGMAFDVRSLSIANASGMEKLRRSWNQSLRAVERELLRVVGGRKGRLSARPGYGPYRQRWQLRTGKYSLGDTQNWFSQHAPQSVHRNAVGSYDGGRSVRTFRHWRDDSTVPARSRRARVYDLLDAGPRHQFVIAGATEPLIVHNCTQAAAADILRGTLVRLDATPSMPSVRAHTHDEVLLEAHVDRADDVAERLKTEMESGFDWSAGLPLKCDVTTAYSYTKCRLAQGL